MSGVELAGLVLGVLPLLIQGIESYNEGLDPIKSFMRWEKELPHFIRKLRNQHVHYSQTIGILLAPITEEIELAEMMTDPGLSRMWRDQEIAARLRDRLQDSYDAYQSTMLDIERITKKIASKLDLDRADELKRNDLEALLAGNPKNSSDKFEFTKRVRFGMSKKTIKALLEELDDCNKELERFTDKSEKIETYRKSVKPSFASRLQRIQGYAKGLHGSLNWSCACKSSHQTSLQLQPRSDLYTAGTKTKAPTKTCFAVSFSTSDAASQVSWRYQTAEIHVEDAASLTPLSSPLTSPLPSPRPTMSKSVTFGSLPPYAVEDPVAYAGQTLKQVEDLCASIDELKTSASCIGFSLDTENKLRGAYVVERADKFTPCTEKTTLEDLLGRPPMVNGKRTKLNRKERYSLALTLASSVLYLNSTPWLTNQWAAKDIFFHQTSTASRPIDIERPYVVPVEATESKIAPNGKTRSFHNKNTVLLALAIALLELYFGTTAEKYQESENGESDPLLHQNPWMLCHMAHTWAEETQEDLSAAFSSAVRHCLRCFSDPGASLQDAEFLQAAVEGIVLPLQEELYQFLGKSMA